MATLAQLFEMHLDAWLEAPLAELNARLAHPPLELLAMLESKPDLSGLTGPLAEHLRVKLQAKNQFATLPIHTLEQPVRSWLSELGKAIASDQRESLLSSIPQRLSPVLKQLGTHETVSHEYTPELQLKVLGLEWVSLAGPVLDIGCGASAGLVKHLRKTGVDATGLDREAPPDVAIRGDWLSYNYGERAWGTIVSHLGFSLHFLNRHLSRSTEAERYARVYMAILRGLKPGGLFAYAPGLRFIESLLPANLYRVETIPLPDQLRTETLANQRDATGIELDPGTKIRKLG